MVAEIKIVAIKEILRAAALEKLRLGLRAFCEFRRKIDKGVVCIIQFLPEDRSLFLRPCLTPPVIKGDSVKRPGQTDCWCSVGV